MKSTSKKWTIAPILLGLICLFCSSYTVDKEADRIQKAARVFEDFKKMKESIPASILQDAEGMVIIPKMINAGFGIGGKRGRGVAMVKLASGTWSDPVFVTITGGSIGFQAGVQAVDLVLLFKHKEALTDAKNGDFTIGGDLSAAAGPVGRSTSANTDYKLDAEVYSYSRSKGLFAGISINGSNIAFDKTSNSNYYGADADTQKLFSSASDNSSAVKTLRSALSSK
ncbi:lipid-binding SYLF domain-containing protein [Olivibacter sp. XZL3]|uniref:lipid-binding SYLF domain-containing protein n=1 Tax=Olivibacter sp. XZL3 TaxID=1735116 RepID=UPI001066F53A|nr:lipid-binding SYLF domain-containing protein [Olivibacter sp. XZL3]